MKDSRRLNTRALGTADVVPILSSGLDTVEKCLLAIRALFTVIVAEMPDSTSDEADDDPYGDEIRKVVAVVLHDLAECLRAFGDLVIAESESAVDEAKIDDALAQSLDVLRETQAILTDLIMVRTTRDDVSWLMRGSIIAAIEQVLSGLDVNRRESQYRQWYEAQQSQRVVLPTMIQSVLPHPERPLPRGLQVPGGWRRQQNKAAPDEKIAWPDE